MKKSLASLAAAAFLVAGSAPALGQGGGDPICRPVAVCNAPEVTTAPPPQVIEIPAPPKKKPKKPKGKAKKAAPAKSASATGGDGATPFRIAIF